MLSGRALHEQFVRTLGLNANCCADTLLIPIAQERHRCGLLVAGSMVLHRQIPMVIGSGRSSLEHKVRCICRGYTSEAGLLSKDVLPPSTGQGSSAADSGFLFPQALLAPGILHILWAL